MTLLWIAVSSGQPLIYYQAAYANGYLEMTEQDHIHGQSGHLGKILTNHLVKFANLDRFDSQVDDDCQDCNRNQVDREATDYVVLG